MLENLLNYNFTPSDLFQDNTLVYYGVELIYFNFWLYILLVQLNRLK